MTEPSWPDMQSGDLCQFGPGDFQVTHYRCDEHRDGTVTDVRTGEVVERADFRSPRGFSR